VPRVPIIRVGDVLVATLLEEIQDHDGLLLQEELCRTLEKSSCRGVLLDLSVVQTVDSFLGRLLVEIASTARLMGAQTILVGIRPAIAVTLVELGLQMDGLQTALNSQKGMGLLRKLMAADSV
jgi:rsbT antagonist protein RsbS